LLYPGDFSIRRRDLDSIGGYRTHTEPMQIVSGPDYARKIHYEAPPSKQIPTEMLDFLKWFNETSSGGVNPVSAITRAGIAHLWFESIHPFEDGNGRIGRAIAEKALGEGLLNPVITVLAKILLKRRKKYYEALSLANKSMEVTDWLLWFATAVIEAQKSTLCIIEFIIQKTRLMERVSKRLNKRQKKALLRMFREGPEGFKGGMSAANYKSITGATTPTTTRDLHDLVNKNALTKSGARKATRYFLAFNIPAVTDVTIDDIL